MEELPKVYSPQEVEQKWYKNWEENDYFRPDFAQKATSGKPFSIVIPPPNITGNLHMGHALNCTIQDVFVRFKRMQGFKTLWLPGTDHASIATENIVEKELKKQGTSKHQLGREKFLEKVWQWKEECGSNITRQLRRLGASCDWSRERFTMDEVCTRAVNHEFIELYKQGLIYRGKYLVNWCPKCHTAISDIEVVYEERKGKLWHIKYLVASSQGQGSKDYLLVATTRPETMLGDTAVAVNPKDKRFKHLIGKMLELPIVGRKIPIIADGFVDPKFGTGAVKVTPAHDTNDFEIGERHNLPRINILDSHARFVLDDFSENEKVALQEWQGLNRDKLREKVLERLEKEGFLEKTEDYENKVGECYRCKTVIEPYLSDQWYLKIKPLAEKAIQAVEEGKIQFVPDRWTKVYLNWMENLKDWCISRQLFWGHRIPVWYCRNRYQGVKGSRCQEKNLETLEPGNLDTCDEIIVSEEPPEKCPKCGGEVVQDEDVFDTWFSSALWPFSTLGWPEKTEDLKTFYPTSVLVTGYDIITFWVSRMIMMGLHFMKERPFETVYIHGLVRDFSGRKMSKSLGNVVDPIKLIDEIGADALRFALASLVTGQGQDIKLTQEKLIEARNFANKIWNVSRFVLMNAKGQGASSKGQGIFEDKWILSRFNQTIKKTTSLLTEYDFGEGARVLYDFIWSEFCDWYVEFSKIRLYGQDEKTKQTVIFVLSEVLQGILKLLHPYMPFVTEEIYQRYQGIKVSRYQEEILGTSIMLSPWPKVNKKQIDPKVEKQMALAMDVIRAIRNIRAEMSVSHSKTCDAIIVCKEDKVLKLMEAQIKNLAKVEKLEIVGKLKDKPKQAASAIIENAEIYVPLAGLIDFEKEKERLGKAIDKIEKEKNEIENRLNNKNFIDKAPREKVEEAKARLKSLQEELKLLSARIVALK